MVLVSTLFVIIWSGLHWEVLSTHSDCESACFLTVIKDQRLESSNKLVLHGIKWTECLGRCMYIHICHSVNVESNNSTCEINYATDTPKNLVRSKGWVYYEKYIGT